MHYSVFINTRDLYLQLYNYLGYEHYNLGVLHSIIDNIKSKSTLYLYINLNIYD